MRLGARTCLLFASLFVIIIIITIVALVVAVTPLSGVKQQVDCLPDGAVSSCAWWVNQISRSFRCSKDSALYLGMI